MTSGCTQRSSDTPRECKAVCLLSRDCQIQALRRAQDRPHAARSRFLTGIWQSPLSEIVDGLSRPFGEFRTGLMRRARGHSSAPQGSPDPGPSASSGQASCDECGDIPPLPRDRQIPALRRGQDRPHTERSRLRTGIWQSPSSEIVDGLASPDPLARREPKSTTFDAASRRVERSEKGSNERQPPAGWRASGRLV